MKVTLEELQAFVVVIDSGSITAAAEQLGQTAYGISRALRRLETKLDTTLLHRTTRRLALSQEGELFLAQAREVIASVEQAEELMAVGREQPCGTLRVNAAFPFMQHAIVPLIPEFRRIYPHIQLQLNTDDVFIDLLEQHTDIAIRIGTLRDSSFHARLLDRTRTRILASPDYLQRHGVPQSVEALDNHVLFGFTHVDALNVWPLRKVNGELYRIKPALVASSGETLRQLALRGEGIVRLSDFMTLDDQKSGRLVPVLAHQTIETRMPVNAVYYRNTKLTARISCFLDFLSEKMAHQLH